ADPQPVTASVETIDRLVPIHLVHDLSRVDRLVARGAMRAVAKPAPQLTRALTRQHAGVESTPNLLGERDVVRHSSPANEAAYHGPAGIRQWVGVALRRRVSSYRAGPVLGALTETLVDSRDRSGQLVCEELRDSCRGADGDDAAIRLGLRHTARG